MVVLLILILPVVLSIKYMIVRFFLSIVVLVWICLSTYDFYVLKTECDKNQISLTDLIDYPGSYLSHFFLNDGLMKVALNSDEQQRNDLFKIRKIFKSKEDFQEVITWGEKIASGLSRCCINQDSLQINCSDSISEQLAAHLAWQRIVSIPGITESDIFNLNEFIVENLASEDLLTYKKWAKNRINQRSKPIIDSTSYVSKGCRKKIKESNKCFTGFRPRPPNSEWFLLWTILDEGLINDELVEAKIKQLKLLSLNETSRDSLQNYLIEYGEYIISKNKKLNQFSNSHSRMESIYLLTALSRLSGTDGFDEKCIKVINDAKQRLLITKLSFKTYISLTFSSNLTYERNNCFDNQSISFDNTINFSPINSFYNHSYNLYRLYLPYSIHYDQNIIFKESKDKTIKQNVLKQNVKVRKKAEEEESPISIGFKYVETLLFATFIFTFIFGIASMLKKASFNFFEPFFLIFSSDTFENYTKLNKFFLPLSIFINIIVVFISYKLEIMTLNSLSGINYIFNYQYLYDFFFIVIFGSIFLSNILNLITVTLIIVGVNPHDVWLDEILMIIIYILFIKFLEQNNLAAVTAMICAFIRPIFLFKVNYIISKYS